MGCASSTPMIATAGSDILKAATHAASDAAKGAEHAVEGVAENVGKTLDSAKESVGTAVTGIAHELGNVFTEKTGELDAAKNELLERLHLGGGATKALEHSSEATLNQLDTVALEAVARAPTPPPDLDSLKTSTPEPEIEQAMANSHEDTPPTPKPTIAELEKLTAEVKQTAQTTMAATTVTESHVAEGNRAPAQASSGTTAATEPAVDVAARLAAEKRPGTTEWEKHADHLSKTRKMNEFKGGGKFRRFGPPIAPLSHYPKPIDSMNIKRALLEDDSCYSDAYYNSQSSPTNSDSPKVRRARLPINGVLATNAKRMQREFATFVSNRRSTASALRSLTVSPALGRRFDYNPQRARIPSPTPSLLAYTRAGYTTPAVVNPELLPNSRTANWKRGLANVRVVSPPPLGAHAPRCSSHIDPSLADNVIPQTKLTSTKAFAPLRGEKIAGRTRIFGQTRSGSPVNRRVFARREDKAAARCTRSGSAERMRALMQAKVEAGIKKEQVVQAPTTTIRLEREASIKGNKESGVGETPANVFSLSRALSPIKMAAETHSLPHMKSEASKTATMAHSMLEVVEQAVERAKNGGLSMEADVKLATEDRDIKKQGERIRTPVKSMKDEKQGDDKKKIERKNDEDRKQSKNQKAPTNEIFKDNDLHGKPGKWSDGGDSTAARSESNTANSKTSSILSSKQSASSLRRNSKSRSPIKRKENVVTEKYIDQKIGLRRKSISPSTNMDDSPRGSFEVKGRFSMSPSKKESLNYNKNAKKRNTWMHSSPENREQSSSHSTTHKPALKLTQNLEQRLENAEKSRTNLKNTPPENEHLNKGRKRERVAYSGQAKKKQSQSNWTSLSRRNSQDEYANMIHRFEYYTDTSIISKHSSPRPRKQVTSLKSDETNTTSVEEVESSPKTEDSTQRNNMKNKTPDYEKVPRTSFNGLHANNWHEKDQHAKARNNISSSHSRTAPKPEKKNIRQQQQVHRNFSTSIKPMHIENHEQNNNEHKLQRSKNTELNQAENHSAKDNQVNNRRTNAEPVQKTNNLTHQLTHTNSSTQNSHNSSPSKSSKSSTSIIICTNLSTPDTEVDNEAALSDELTQALQQLELRNEAVDEEDSSFHHSDDGSLHSKHEDSSRTDNEAEPGTDMELSYHADVEITSVSSMDDLINMLSPEVAYLNLGRSATMMTLRTTTPSFNAPSSFRSTPHGSPNRRRHYHYLSNDSDQFEKRPFVAEFSSLARSRSPQVPPSPYKIRARCAVCYNKYVIK